MYKERITLLFIGQIERLSKNLLTRSTRTFFLPSEKVFWRFGIGASDLDTQIVSRIQRGLLIYYCWCSFGRINLFKLLFLFGWYRSERFPTIKSGRKLFYCHWQRGPVDLAAVS